MREIVFVRLFSRSLSSLSLRKTGAKLPHFSLASRSLTDAPPSSISYTSLSLFSSSLPFRFLLIPSFIYAEYVLSSGTHLFFAIFPPPLSPISLLLLSFSLTREGKVLRQENRSLHSIWSPLILRRSSGDERRERMGKSRTNLRFLIGLGSYLKL